VETKWLDRAARNPATRASWIQWQYTSPANLVITNVSRLFGLRNRAGRGSPVKIEAVVAGRLPGTNGWCLFDATGPLEFADAAESLFPGQRVLIEGHSQWTNRLVEVGERRFRSLGGNPATEPKHITPEQPLTEDLQWAQAEGRIRFCSWAENHWVLELEDNARSLSVHVLHSDPALRPPDGLGLCRGLKRAELTSHIPVIVLASPGQESSQPRALEAAAHCCVPKPLDLPQLKARIDELLGARSKMQTGLGPADPLRPNGLAMNQADSQFLHRAVATVDRHLCDFEFDVEVLAKRMAMSRRQLFRKLKAVTGGTPNTLIRAMRLKRAAQLLQESQMTITEVTYAVGFSDLKHFRAVFREQFGVLPGEYPRRASSEPAG
jgi:AraC-like DNA-binding protein/CheY-like chemotaxis protein